VDLVYNIDAFFCVCRGSTEPLFSMPWRLNLVVRGCINFDYIQDTAVINTFTKLTLVAGGFRFAGFCNLRLGKYSRASRLAGTLCTDKQIGVR